MRTARTSIRNTPIRCTQNALWPLSTTRLERNVMSLDDEESEKVRWRNLAGAVLSLEESQRHKAAATR